MKSKLIAMTAILALLTFMISALAGCSGNNSAPAEATEATEAAQTVQETEAAQAAQEETAAPAETSAAAEEAVTEAQAADSEASGLVGSWEYEDLSGFVYTFNEDGTGSYTVLGETLNFTYIDHGDSVELMYEDVDGSETYGYSIDGNTFTIQDSVGNAVRYTRK